MRAQKNIILIALLASLTMHLVYGLEGQAQMGELQYEIDHQRAIIQDRNIEIELLNMLLDQQEEPEPKQIYAGEFTVTFYCPCYKCCGKTDAITASGTIAAEGQTVAADWDILPPGTKIFIEGIGFRTVEDSGGWIKGNKLDVFMDGHSAALDAGVVQAKVYIVED